MNFTNLIYLVLWWFCYIVIMLVVPYGTTLLQGVSVLAPFWASIPDETKMLVNILLYIVVPLVAIAYTIKASSPENQIVVQP